MPTERAHDIEQILSVYMEAKLDSAAMQMLQAKRWVEMDRNVYTEGKLLWAEHQYAAFKIVARDVASWRNVIKNYYRKLRKRARNVGDPVQEVITDTPQPFAF